jgi:murein L,D-transpeptidase YcbB/YkuD
VDEDKLRKVLTVLGISLVLFPLVIVALADPEPVTKLAAIGLTVVEVEALLVALGMKTPSAGGASASLEAGGIAANAQASISSSLSGGGDTDTTSSVIVPASSTGTDTSSSGGTPEPPAARAQKNVAGIQKALQRLGFDPGQIDGVMGPDTRAAIKQFQEANGLAVDGIPGPKTQAALARALKAGAAADA